jgi:CheY-like chemotaxis protein
MQTFTMATKENVDSRPTILIVDDDKALLLMTGRLLELNGYRVLKALTGTEAIEKARIEKPGLILMDIGLPGMDGLSVTRLIHQIKELRDVPIIAVSGSNTVETRVNAFLAGCTWFIAKPINFDILKTLLDVILPINQPK